MDQRAARRSRCAGWMAIVIAVGCASTGTPPVAGCRTRCDPSGPDGAGCGPCQVATEADRSVSAATRAAYDFQRAIEPLDALHPGPELEREACARAATLRDRARALSEGPVPSPYRFHDYDWAAQTDRLLAQADALLTVCTVPPQPTISDLLASVRTAFRSLALRLGVTTSTR